MSATFALSAAICLPLIAWLQGGGFPLAPDQQTARLSDSVIIARTPRLVSGSNSDQVVEKPAMRDKSLKENLPEWADATVVGRVDDAVAPLTMQRTDAKRSAATVDPDAKPPPSEVARRARRERIAVAERAKVGTVSSTSEVSAPPPPAAARQVLHRWPTADEPFIGPEGVNK